MLINLRNALMAGKRLPYDAEVEYLESTGTQYIDTLFFPTATTSVEIYCKILSAPNNYNSFFGCGTAFNGANVFCLVAAKSNSRIFCYRGSKFNQTTANNAFSGGDEIFGKISPTQGGIHNYTKGQDFYVDLSSSTYTQGQNSLYLFNGNVPGTADLQRGSNIRIYNARIFNGTVITHDFIPVRKGTVGYLYDRVSGKLFGNAGTGDFVLGPDVVPVEYIEATGVQYIDTGFNITNAQSFAYDVKFSLAQSITNSQPRLLSNEGAGAGNYYDIYFVNGVLRARQANVAVNNAQRDTPIVAKMTEQGRYYGYYESTPDALLWNGTRAFTSPTVNMNYRLFCRGNDAVTQYRWQGKAWYMRFWKDGVPIRSFRPVRVGTDATSWEGAMMDTLTRRIYRNQGTGAFTYGNDLKYPIPA